MAKKKNLPKQSALIEDKFITEICDAARVYRDTMAERMELAKEEVELKHKLIELMEKHKRTTYQTVDSLVVSIKEREAERTVKVKQTQAPQE